jgi:hypothetical protein
VWGQAIIDKIKDLMESAGFTTEEVNLMKSNFFKAIKVPYYDRFDQVRKQEESHKQVSRTVIMKPTKQSTDITPSIYSFVLYSFLTKHIITHTCSRPLLANH